MRGFVLVALLAVAGAGEVRAQDAAACSDANKKSDITWNEATFREYIRDPKAKVPGTK